MKKVLALTLVLVLALSMSTVAFAATSATKIDYKEWNYDTNLGTPAEADGTAYNDVNGNGRTTIYIPIIQGTNLAAVDNGPTAATPATVAGDIAKNVFTRSDMGVKLRWSKGSQILDEATIDKDNSRIEIKFNSEVATIKDIDYKFEVLVTFGGRTLAGGTTSGGDAYTFEGTWERNLEEIGDAEWFDFDGTASFKTDTFVRKFEYGFNGLATGYGRALKGVEYWGDADEDVEDADEEVMIAHAAIVSVIHMNQINVKSVLDYVKLDDSDSSLYVYDGDLNLLGKGNEELPYADTYYLAAALLDVEGEEEPEEEIEEEYEPGDFGDNSGTGGDDLYPENPHDNPGTGK